MKSLALALLAVSLSAADYPRPSGYVNDFAGQLDPAARSALENKLRDFEHTTSIEVAVAIVQSLEGEPVEQYANGLFHSWGIGKRGRDNGVLFLWAPNERKLRIEVGYGIESALPKDATDQILADARPLFRDERYSDAVNAVVDGITGRLGTKSAAEREE